MADTYEKDLAQKTSLTTSDYIRVVGSDNVSYKQLVSAVMTAMGLDAIKNPATNVSNIDTATATGFYSYNSSASGTNPLSGSGGDLIVIAHSTTYSVQVAIPYSSINGMAIYKRVILSGTPSDWQKQPTRAEVDALSSSNAGHTLGSGATVTITLSKYQCAGTLYGAVGNSLGFAYSFGNGYLAPIKTATGVSVTLGSDYKTITVTNSTSASGRVGMSVTEGATVTMA